MKRGLIIGTIFASSAASGWVMANGINWIYKYMHPDVPIPIAIQTIKPPIEVKQDTPPTIEKKTSSLKDKHKKPKLPSTPILVRMNGQGFYQEDFEHPRRGQHKSSECNADPNQCLVCLGDDSGNQICQWINKK